MADRKYIYGQNTIFRPESESIEDVKAALTDWFPELENADAIEREDGSVEFVVRAATKGADRKYVYGQNTIFRPADEPIEDVVDALTDWFPELENAEWTEAADGSVTLTVRAATKGA